MHSAFGFGHDRGTGHGFFAEAFEAHLCMPITACGEGISERIERTTVDPHGDKVWSIAFPGDGFRTCHDLRKLLIQHLCVWRKIKIQDVFGLFAHLIP